MREKHRRYLSMMYVWEQYNKRTKSIKEQSEDIQQYC
jgi:hypothetical protein